MAAVIQREQMSALASDEQRPVRRIATEFGIALLILLLFFFVVFGIMSLYFPIGTSLKGLAQTIGTSVSPTGSKDLFIAGTNNPQIMAIVTELGNKVNVKSANTIAWSKAQLGMALADRDAIQTYAKGRALIEFGGDNYLDIGENSLVVLQGMEADLFVNKLRTFRVEAKGELRGKLQRSSDGLTNLQVALPGADLKMVPGEGEQSPVEFKLAVNKDKSSTLSISKGGAEVMIGGKSVSLGENFGVTIGADGKTLGPVALPARPILKLPVDGNAAYFRKRPPKIRFAWESEKPVSAYRFMLSRDPEFRQLLVDERVKRASFTHGNLKKGEYYWRVHSLTDDIEGMPSEVRKLRMVQDRTPPRLKLQKPPTIIRQPTITLRGKTEPGTKVYIEGTAVRVSAQGVFTHKLSVKPGATLVVVEAVDPAGNIAYATNLLNGKF
ncbi:MAG: DUF4962 domain-containing protein [Gammaproteobacteria bacterium]|nr:DUF4962 domain-containing protein [Gammaproteobacteria bacterium]